MSNFKWQIFSNFVLFSECPNFNEIKTEPTLLVVLFTFTTMPTGTTVFETYKIVVLNYIFYENDIGIHYSNPPIKWAGLYFLEGLMNLQG